MTINGDIDKQVQKWMTNIFNFCSRNQLLRVIDMKKLPKILSRNFIQKAVISLTKYFY